MTTIPGAPDLKLRLFVEGTRADGREVHQDITVALDWLRGEEITQLKRSLRQIAEQIAPDRDPDNHPLYPEDV